MPKNIVICCDGTGNAIGADISNVLKLYRVTNRPGPGERQQVVYYHPGVGTLARPSPWHRFKQNLGLVVGLAFGYGLDDNVLAAYEFLVETYEDGDDIFLFGFSRGAYTARVLAALIHKIGLMRPQQANLSGAALTAFKQTTLAIQNATNAASARAQPDDEDTVAFVSEDKAAQFARIASPRRPVIRFLGVWDTVASVIVPRPDRFYTFSLERLAFTQKNPSVEVFRHAMAIDERRRMFRLLPWTEGQDFESNPFRKSETPRKQDCKQVWFAGVHCDVGGGYPETESGLSKYPLLWMLEEARAHGLAASTATINQLAWGRQRRNSPHTYVAPAVDAKNGMTHDSMNPGWQILEHLPKNKKYRECEDRRVFLDHYLPRSEPRVVPEGARIHASVFAKIKSDPGYRPKNLPARYVEEPMPVGP